MPGAAPARRPPLASGAPLRSLLFCPGNNERRIQKALASGADAVILDLEDSVHPDAKPQARALVVKALAAERAAPVVVRVNAEETSWHLADLAAILRARPDAIMLPKCDGPRALQRLSDRLDALEAAYGLPHQSIAVLPLITETALALADMAYAEATPRLAALCFGAEDLAADLGVDARDDGWEMNPLLAHARLRVAITAAAAGVAAIDMPYPDPGRPDLLAAEAGQAAALGFAGKLCIHPDQIAAVHDAFRPAAARIARAQATVDALGMSATGVAVVDGRMVDRAHLKLACRYLGMAAADTKTE